MDSTVETATLHMTLYVDKRIMATNFNLGLFKATVHTKQEKKMVRKVVHSVAPSTPPRTHASFAV